MPASLADFFRPRFTSFQIWGQAGAGGAQMRRGRLGVWIGDHCVILFFHDPTMLRALGGKLREENQYGGKRGGFASHHKLKMCQNKGR